MSGFENIAVPASQYTYQQLADVYNQTRIDYIVPMPMNAKRMQEYIDHYDLDLDNSIIATTEKVTRWESACWGFVTAAPGLRA